MLILLIYSNHNQIGPYSFQIESEIWNFSNLVNNNHQVFSFRQGDNIFYTTFLDNLTTKDLPGFFFNDQSNIFSAIKCNLFSRKCYPLISNKAFNIRKISNITDEKNGILFHGQGEPFVIDNKYFRYEISHYFYCNSAITNHSNPTFLLTKNETIEGLYHLSIKYESIYGCSSPRFYPVQSNNSHKPSIGLKSTFSTLNMKERMKPTPYPIPDTILPFTKGDYKIELNLSKYSNKYEANVYSYGLIHNYQLFYNPTDSIQCPEGFECNDDDEAIVWLCTNKKCDAYGLLQNNFQSQLAYFSGITSAVIITYFGENGKSAPVTFECDRSFLNDDSSNSSIRLPNGINLINSTLSFSVGVKEACPVSTIPNPSPLPDVHIPMPQSDVFPSPNPNPSSLFFVRNSTHYTAFEIAQLTQNVFRGNLPLLVDQSFGVMYTEYSPWNLIECPKGWQCPFAKEANFWGCWETNADDILSYEDDNIKSNADLIPYCHPLGDKRIDTKMIPIAPNHLERGVLLRYAGANGISAEMKIECNNLSSPPLLLLDSSSIIFHRALSGPDVSYNLSSSLVCPQEFRNPMFPTPLPNPTPSFDPDKTVVYQYKSPIISKKRIKLDLSVLQEIQQWVVFGLDDSYELAFLAFNPSQQIECPSNYDCGEMEPANAWKCSKSNKCFSIADSRYDLLFDLINKTDLSAGVSVEYKGGFANYSFRINMICKPTKTGRLLELPDVSIQDSADIRLLIIDVLTNYSCPVSIDGKDGDSDFLYISGGSIFLLILLISIIFYLTIGSIIVYHKTGIISLPNSEFWTEFCQSVATGFMHLFSCCNFKKQSHKRSYTGI